MTALYARVCSISCQTEETGVAETSQAALDYGVHPPTMYFPLIVSEALMIEPTETESIEALDAFADAMLAIAEECERDKDKVIGAPHTTVVGRLDEVRAARKPDLKWSRG